eukprot:5789671-Pyramimonas_sp.AAC.4
MVTSNPVFTRIMFRRGSPLLAPIVLGPAAVSCEVQLGAEPRGGGGGARHSEAHRARETKGAKGLEQAAAGREGLPQGNDRMCTQGRDTCRKSQGMPGHLPTLCLVRDAIVTVAYSAACIETVLIASSV